MSEETKLNSSFSGAISDEEIRESENYFFRLATLEVRKFSRESEFKHCSVEKNKILYYVGRILVGQEITDVENILPDVPPLNFVKPLVDRYSPVAYSIMLFCHTEIVKHRNAMTTLRKSREFAFILHGRELAIEVRNNCPHCRRFKARLLQAELGRVHPTRLTIAPAFYNCQVDLFGPLLAHCEHNHRSAVKI